MAAVTIGVPVYNGADRLEACLECLRTQTFKDIEVLIYDNASEDETGAIARSFVERDSRFSYFRQSENKGPYVNFVDVLDAAKSEYFLWRAHDDLSDPNYIEVLHGLLEANPDAVLAASRVFNTNPDGSATRLYPVPDTSGPTPLSRIRKMLFRAHPSWVYALWRRAAIQPIIHNAYRDYPYPWASDHLMLFGPIIDEAIVTTDATTFTQLSRIRPTRVRATVAEMVPARRAYIRYCDTEAASRDFSTFERILMHRLIRQHASDRCYGLRKIARRYVRELVRG